jgi:holliday junction DNA helicase RuvA
LLLMQVKGIGPKTSADMISRVDKRELLRLIGSADTASLQKVKGVGKKTAERIIVELKDKVGNYAVERNLVGGLTVEIEVVDPFKEASQALQALGFSLKDAERAIQMVRGLNLATLVGAGDVVKEALRFV